MRECENSLPLFSPVPLNLRQHRNPMGTINVPKAGHRGWLYGMGMDSYKARISDSCPYGCGAKTKSYKPMSQIVQPMSQFFWY